MMDGQFMIVASARLQQLGLVCHGHRGMETFGIWFLATHKENLIVNTASGLPIPPINVAELLRQLLSGDLDTYKSPANQRSVMSGTILNAASLAVSIFMPALPAMATPSRIVIIS